MRNACYIQADLLVFHANMDKCDTWSHTLPRYWKSIKFRCANGERFNWFSYALFDFAQIDISKYCVNVEWHNSICCQSLKMKIVLRSPNQTWNNVWNVSQWCVSTFNHPQIFGVIFEARRHASNLSKRFRHSWQYARKSVSDV